MQTTGDETLRRALEEVTIARIRDDFKVMEEALSHDIGDLKGEVRRLNAVASERWHQLKACEKLIRQLERALKGVLYVAKTDPGGVPYHLRRDIREAEKVLEIVASVKRERRRK